MKGKINELTLIVRVRFARGDMDIPQFTNRFSLDLELVQNKT